MSKFVMELLYARKALTRIIVASMILAGVITISLCIIRNVTLTICMQHLIMLTQLRSRMFGISVRLPCAFKAPVDFLLYIIMRIQRTYMGSVLRRMT